MFYRYGKLAPGAPASGSEYTWLISNCEKLMKSWGSRIDDSRSCLIAFNSNYIIFRIGNDKRSNYPWGTKLAPN